MNTAQMARRLRLPAGPTLALLTSVVLGQGSADPAQQLPAVDDAAAQPVQPMPAAAPPPADPTPAGRSGPGAGLNLALLQRGGPRPEVSDVFAGRTWAPPPPPPSPPPPAAPEPPSVAPEPTAPPLPFTYVGKLEEEGGPTTYFLERGPQVLAIAAGEAIDAQYRLAEASVGELAFVYLPLQERQVLRLPP